MINGSKTLCCASLDIIPTSRKFPLPLRSMEVKMGLSISHLYPVFTSPHLTPLQASGAQIVTLEMKKVRPAKAVTPFRDTQLVKAELTITIVLP